MTDRPCLSVSHGSPMTGPDIDRDGTRSLPLAGSNNAAARAGVLEVPPTPWVQPEARRRDELAYLWCRANRQNSQEGYLRRRTPSFGEGCWSGRETV